MTGDELTPEELLDGLALWDEYRPQSGEDWVAVAERFNAAGDDRSLSSPLFAGLSLAVEQRDAVVLVAEQLRDALREAKPALRSNRVTWIALSDRLDDPYPDAPGDSPWSRFALPVCRRSKEAEEAIDAALAAASGVLTKGRDDG